MKTLNIILNICSAVVCLILAIAGFYGVLHPISGGIAFFLIVLFFFKQLFKSITTPSFIMALVGMSFAAGGMYLGFTGALISPVSGLIWLFLGILNMFELIVEKCHKKEY